MSLVAFLALAAPIERMDKPSASYAEMKRQTPAEQLKPPAATNLDFLAGDWVLTDSSGRRVGSSHVEVELPGAMIHEVRKDENGELAVWFVRTERTGGWSQLFPGPSGTLREFTPVSGPGQWPFVLAGKAILVDGRHAQFRLKMTRESDQASHRLLQMSTDGGTSWEPIFDYHYRRAPR